jgi:hypothetical protein
MSFIMRLNERQQLLGLFDSCCRRSAVELLDGASNDATASSSKGNVGMMSRSGRPDRMTLNKVLEAELATTDR